MSDPNTKQLLDRMLSSGKLSAEAAQDLRDFQADLAKDMLDPEDAAYVAALARRRGFLGGVAPAEDAADGADEEDDLPAAPALASDAAEVLAAVRGAVDALCHPDRLAGEDPDREAKARLHAALTARLDEIGRDFA